MVVIIASITVVLIFALLTKWGAGLIGFPVKYKNALIVVACLCVWGVVMSYAEKVLVEYMVLKQAKPSEEIAILLAFAVVGITSVVFGFRFLKHATTEEKMPFKKIAALIFLPFLIVLCLAVVIAVICMLMPHK